VILKNYKKFSDESLISSIKKGNTAAFNELYHRYSKRLFIFFLQMLNGDEENAKDFLQDIFITIIEKSHYFQGDRVFSSWVFTIAKNMCINEYHSLKTKNRIADYQTDYFQNIDLVKYYPELDEQIDKKKFMATLLSELNNLTHESKTIFLLRFQEDFSIKEISEVTSLPQGTVKSRLFYISKKMAKKLETLNPNF
jgi:RNA polymerase sigma-70 factor (ECF subfamily)